MSQDERIIAIEAENRQLRQALDMAMAQNALLLERVRELEARLAKDSRNSAFQSLLCCFSDLGSL